MLESIYVGVTGLVGFSRDLSVIGNNVANLNTAGFKASQLLFSDLFYRTQYSGEGADGVPGRLDFGNGVAAGSTRIVFSQGELRQTGNDQDAAITGNGFFVLRRDDRVFYTRAGQFGFDADGYLVSPAQGARVQALAGGGLRDVNLLGRRTNDGQATTKVEFSGVLDSSDSSGVPTTVAEILLYGTGGATRTVSASFTHDTAVAAGRWLVDVKDSKGALLASGQIEFNEDGTPAAGFNSFIVPPADGTTDAVEFFFGDPGSSSGARSVASSSSSLAVSQQDGYGVGSLTKATFDDTGTMQLQYSNGQTATGEQLALAAFDDLQGLAPVQGSLFVPGPGGEVPVLGVAKTGAFGTITGGSVELANVDLAREFSDLIVSQRGYQASSQVISTANEMIQQLFAIKSGR